jgi:hypothetical protein
MIYGTPHLVLHPTGSVVFGSRSMELAAMRNFELIFNRKKDNFRDHEQSMD